MTSVTETPATGRPALRLADAPEREILPQQDTIYSVTGPNTGLSADVHNPYHFPVEAICGPALEGIPGGEIACNCGGVIRAEDYLAEWKHTGRKPGDPR